MLTSALDEVNAELEGLGPEERLKWALENLEEVVHASSFGPEDMVVIHLTRGDVPTVFLDTNYHFEETLELVDEVEAEYGLELRVYKGYPSRGEFEEEHGELYETDHDKCCRINKVEPLEEAVEGVDAWITGIRREQAPTRREAKVVEEDGARLKVNPLVDWTSEDVWRFIEENDVPYNPLHELGYPSIGCEPCTSPIEGGDDERSGRWEGVEKTECGLHSER